MAFRQKTMMWVKYPLTALKLVNEPDCNADCCMYGLPQGDSQNSHRGRGRRPSTVRDEYIRKGEGTDNQLFNTAEDAARIHHYEGILVIARVDANGYLSPREWGNYWLRMLRVSKRIFSGRAWTNSEEYLVYLCIANGVRSELEGCI